MIIIIIIIVILLIIWFNHQYLKQCVQLKVVYRDNKIQEVDHIHNNKENRDVELIADTEQPYIR